MYTAGLFKAKTGVRCPSMFYVMPWWLLFKLILCGLICVDCKYNFALDSAGVDFPTKCVGFVFVLKDAGTTQTPCVDAFSPNSDAYQVVLCSEVTW